MRLYKYMSSERLEFFDNHSLRFSQPSELNDPEDCRPTVRFAAPEAFLGTLRNLVAPRIATQLARLPCGPRREEARRIWEDRLSFLAERLTQSRAAHTEIFMEVMNSNFGVLSLTTSPTNPEMWKGYAHDYDGYVIEMDGSDPFFHQRANDIDGTGEVAPVTYSSGPPEVQVDATVNRVVGLVPALFKKTLKWQYEDERRIVRELRLADTAVGDIYLFTVPPQAIISIIFGERFDTGRRSGLMTKIRECSPGIAEKQATRDALGRVVIG